MSYQQKLADRVENQVLACIGCNDCLLACPIAESRGVTIAELNHAVHQPTIHQPNVVQFLSSCTQCKQCVPACPADLNRAEMVLFNKLKVEDAIPNHELLLQTERSAVPSGFTLDGLAQGLASLEISATPAPSAYAARFKSRRCGSSVRTKCWRVKASFTSGSPSSSVARSCKPRPGRAASSSTSSCSARVVLRRGGRARRLSGVVRGHRARSEHRPRNPEACGAAAHGAVAGFRRHDGYPVRAAGTVEPRAQSRRARCPSRSGDCGALDRRDLELVPAGHNLFTQADAPRDFFLVRAGFLRALQHDGVGNRVLTYFREGDLFGLTGLLAREPQHRYAAEAVGRTEVVRFPGASLGNLFARYPQVYAALSASAYEAERLARSSEVGVRPIGLDAHGASVPPPAVAGGVRPSQPSPSFSGAGAQVRPSGAPRPSNPSALSGDRARFEAGVLVEEGIAKGREVLVIDQNLCTGCGNCIDACERRHGTTRLQLRGLQVEHYMFPAACRHCADPACLLCSVNGIVRLPSGEIRIVEDNCIGCGACAERCPYGNINMHAVKQKKRGFWPGMLEFLARGSSPEAAVEALDPKVESVAVKCDLCAGYADYACVTACPVGANFRVDPSRLVAK